MTQIDTYQSNLNNLTLNLEDNLGVSQPEEESFYVPCTYA